MYQPPRRSNGGQDTECGVHKTKERRRNDTPQITYNHLCGCQETQAHIAAYQRYGV